jgi:uncharacterized protein
MLTSDPMHDASRPANRLAHEKSPYLLQHAHNPVDWYPWGEEAFAKARAEDKPIFLSIGYSTCHWCHVMERESFEDEATAQVMNELFVNIKVDREERPDVDRVYMSFVQASTGSGGWPMSVWLTPDLEPFFGGTYFPPGNAHGRPGFVSLLRRIGDLWRGRRDDLKESGRKVLAQMQAHETQAAPQLLDTRILDGAVAIFQKTFDREFGGFGRAPKFPRPVVHNLLLREHARTGDETAARMVLSTLHLMAQGGMVDHLAGGFHRYSVDHYWHVPHFEKMLYDQAQLVVSYLEGYLVSGDERLATVARQTCDYVLHDLVDVRGGFHSAEDADSLDPERGHKLEGAFYVWTKKELDRLLGPSSSLFCAFYGIEAGGNAQDPHGELTGKNVLHIGTTVESLAEALGEPPVVVEKMLAEARAKLLAARAARPRPHLDDKVITAWNGMMIGALAQASRVLKDARYLAAAERAANFVTTVLYDAQERRLRRRYRDGEVGFEGYLDDHAQLASGLLDLYEASLDLRWLTLSEQIAEDMVRLFHDETEGGFFSTSGRDPSVLLRMKEDYDGAEPSGNSIAALVLLRLAALLDRPDWQRAAEGTVRLFSAKLLETPHAMPQLLVAFSWLQQAPLQIVIAGERTDSRVEALVDVVNGRFLPARVVLLADEQTRTILGARLPWLAGMGPLDGKPAAYVCREHACDRPTSDPDILSELLPHRTLVKS